MPSTHDLKDALARLSDARTDLGLRYALIGGIAVVMRGYDRATQDIDAVVWDADDQLDRIFRVAQTHGLQPRLPDAEKFAVQNRMTLLEAPDGTGIDLTMGLLPLEEAIVNRATSP